MFTEQTAVCIKSSARIYNALSGGLYHDVITNTCALVVHTYFSTTCFETHYRDWLTKAYSDLPTVYYVTCEANLAIRLDWVYSTPKYDEIMTIGLQNR